MLFLEVPQKGVITLAACFFATALLLAAVSHRLTVLASLRSAIHDVAPDINAALRDSQAEGGGGHSPSPDPNPKVEVNLPVPFTTQAPTGDWRMPYRAACEEASIAMVHRYALGKGPFSEGAARREILKLVHENERALGDAVDESIEEVQALIARRAPQVVTRVVTDPTVQDLKQELSSGNVIVVPVFGPTLKNPFFHSPPPRYHMLVLRGYTADGFFVANEPGTEQGNGYRYPIATIMEAMHDLKEGNIEEGKKVVLVVEPL